MSVWATQRKLTYISIFVAFMLIVVALPTYYILYKPPTCFDGKQDQNEQGTDCGGPCSILCPSLALDPVVHWSRIFQVTPGWYNAVAYIENVNLGSYALNVPYLFDVYDANKVLIAERRGTIDIWANKKLPIFEPNISTAARPAASVTFQFVAKPIWRKGDLNFPEISVTNPVLTREDTSPRLTAQIENKSFTPISNLSVVGIVYDPDGNAVNASRTSIDYLEKNSPQNIFFVWPLPFNKSISEKEIIPLVQPIGLQQ